MQVINTMYRSPNGVTVEINEDLLAAGAAVQITVRKVGNVYQAVESKEMNTVKPELYDMGLTEGKTFYGNTVRLYDMDRTICDIIKHKEKIALQTYQTAIKEYMRSPQKNLSNLMQYAQALGVEKTVRMYTEVML